MRKLIHTMILSMLALVLTLAPNIATTSVQAAEKTYTVTYRAGNVGTFDAAAIQETSISQDLGMQWGEITDNYVEVVCVKGTNVKTLQMVEEFLAQNVKTVDPKYTLFSYKTMTVPVSTASASEEEESSEETENEEAKVETVTVEAKWGAETAGDNYTVVRNKDFVLDYGVLVDPVSYTIYYVDSASGEQIAPAFIAYGNANESIVATPIHVAGYATSEVARTITLKKGESNSVTFRYTSTYNPGSYYSGIVRENLVPGATTYVTVEGDGAGANANAGAGAGAAGAGAGDAGDAGDVTSINDENSAADQGLQDDTTTIEDEPTAADEEIVEGIGNSVLITTLFIAIIFILLAAIVLTMMKMKQIDAKDKK